MLRSIGDPSVYLMPVFESEEEYLFIGYQFTTMFTPIATVMAESGSPM
jgi:hypothetical protein